jgi:hypothetical protein
MIASSLTMIVLLGVLWLAVRRVGVCMSLVREPVYRHSRIVASRTGDY